jgi:hypothetical protein
VLSVQRECRNARAPRQTGAPAFLISSFGSPCGIPRLTRPPASFLSRLIARHQPSRLSSTWLPILLSLDRRANRRDPMNHPRPHRPAASLPLPHLLSLPLAKPATLQHLAPDPPRADRSPPSNPCYAPIRPPPTFASPPRVLPITLIRIIRPQLRSATVSEDHPTSFPSGLRGSPCRSLIRQRPRTISVALG